MPCHGKGGGPQPRKLHQSDPTFSSSPVLAFHGRRGWRKFGVNPRSCRVRGCGGFLARSNICGLVVFAGAVQARARDPSHVRKCFGRVDGFAVTAQAGLFYHGSCPVTRLGARRSSRLPQKRQRTPRNLATVGAAVGIGTPSTVDCNGPYHG